MGSGLRVFSTLLQGVCRKAGWVAAPRLYV